MEDRTPLPLVDEHQVSARAPRLVVWRQLGASLRGRDQVVGPAVRLLGAHPDGRSGDPLVAGSTFPGFAVVEAVPGELLVLAGRHRFSAYRLVFTLTGADGTTQLVARSEARFPGLHGRAYRALVIGSGGHRVVVRRWLHRIARSSEDERDPTARPEG